MGEHCIHYYRRPVACPKHTPDACRTRYYFQAKWVMGRAVGKGFLARAVSAAKLLPATAVWLLRGSGRWAEVADFRVRV